MSMKNYNPFSLRNKTILVTGASSGIGKATAIECSKLGANIILTARNEERLTETLSILDISEGQRHRLADLTTSEDINNLVDKVEELDGLVNNAGIGISKPIQFIKEEELKKIFSVNTYAPVQLTQQLLKKKRLNKGASIVFTSSIGGNFTVTPGRAMYGMTKGAIHNFMKYCALELANRKIRCNSVNPGMIETPLITSGSLSESEIKDDIARYPLKRYGRPEEVAHAIIYLLSDASSWVTGHALVIDGGITLK